MKVNELKEIIVTWLNQQFPNLTVYEQSPLTYAFEDVETKDEIVIKEIDDELFLELGTHFKLTIPVNKVTVSFICDSLTNYVNILVGKIELEKKNRFLKHLPLLNNEDNIEFLNLYFKAKLPYLSNIVKVSILEKKVLLEMIIDVLKEMGYKTINVNASLDKHNNLYFLNIEGGSEESNPHLSILIYSNNKILLSKIVKKDKYKHISTKLSLSLKDIITESKLKEQLVRLIQMEDLVKRKQ